MYENVKNMWSFHKDAEKMSSCQKDVKSQKVKHMDYGGGSQQKWIDIMRLIHIHINFDVTYDGDMKHIPDEMFIHKVNLRWNLPDQIMCIGSETYQIKFLYIKQICSETYQMKCLYIKQICSETYQMKCLYIKQTYITLDNTPNKISKNIFMSFGNC